MTIHKETFASHLSLLETLFANTNVKTVLEFGMGKASTPFFWRNCKRVHSIEMQNEEWFDIMNEYADQEAWPAEIHLDLILGAYPAIEYVKGLRKRFDLIFVDGHGETRPEVVNWAFAYAKHVVVHDTEEPGYGWERIQTPANWLSIVDTTRTPWTTLYTQEPNVCGSVYRTLRKSSVH